MPCPSTVYRGGRETGRQWHNWLGNISYVVPSYFQPSSRQELVWILQQAEAERAKVKAVGSGWSFEDCAVSEDWVVDIARLNNTITFLTHPATGPTFLTAAWAARQFGAANEKLYHVEAGISIFALNRKLHGEGLAMLTLGGSQGQTLAGAISTSTHGSDLDQPPLPGVVQAIHLVTTGGQEVWIESASEPVTANDRALLSTLGCADLQIVRDDELLRAAMVTVGRFGVVYSYVIKVAALYNLSEWTEELSWPSVSTALMAGIGQGNSVPVRGHLGGLPALLSDPPANLAMSTAVSDFRFLDILISSNLKQAHGDEVCWVRRRWLTHNPDVLNLGAGGNPLCHRGVANAILTVAGAALGAYAAQVAGIPIYGTIKAIEIGIDVTRLNAMAHDPAISGGEALAESLNAVWRAQIDHELEWLVADLNRIILAEGLRKSRKEGKRGPGWQVATGLEERADDDCYRANSIELIFSTATSAYIDFINGLLDNAHRFRIGGYISVRFSSRSGAYLSMHKVGTPLAVSIEVASLHGLEGNDGWIAFAERTAKAMGGRPHWGQQNQMSALDVLTLYGIENLEAWSHQCFRVVGPSSTTFSNRYTRQRGLEPLQRPATAFAMISPSLLDFGRVLEGTLVTRDNGLTIANVGTGSLAIQRVRIVGAQASAFSLTPHPPRALPVTLQRSEAFPVSIRCQSAAEGEHQARVEITSQDHRSGAEATIHAVLVANVVAPDMNVVPTTINFGLITAGQQVQRNVLVTNNGSAPLRFRVAPPPSWSVFQWTGDAPFHWRSVPAGGDATIAVHYKPTATGRHSSEIVIVSEDQTVTVPLFGERVAAPLPAIHAIPRQLSFGLVDVGTATKQLLLANDSAAPLVINGARIEGPDRGLFALPGQIPNIVQAGQTASLVVSFTPVDRVAGGNQATLVIESNAANDPQLSVSLFGVGAASTLRSGWLEPVLSVMMR